MDKFAYSRVNLTLTSDVDLSGRLLPDGYVNFNDVSDGEEYDFEMSARATDKLGNEYIVYWIYTNIKGEDANDLDWYDYSSYEIDRIEKL